MPLHFDSGPPVRWQTVFESAPLNAYETHPSGRFRLDFGPVYYRGRLNKKARVLIIGQDPSTDEILAQRILVGHAGQRLQGLLRKLGLTKSYVMVNSFLFSITGQFDAPMKAIASEPAILSFRNKILDKLKSENALTAVFAFGEAGQHAASLWPGKSGLTVVQFVHPSAPESFVLLNWNLRLPAALAAVAPDPDGVVDPTPYGATFAPADIAPVPRLDLPFGIPGWHGTGDTRSQRNGPKVIQWNAP
jgi:uracil DNA glycosylase superfamily protein